MTIRAFKVELSQIQTLRALLLQENNFQIRYHSCHERNWSDSYLLTVDDVSIGYGSVKGKEKLTDRDAIFEFFIILPYRKISNAVFSALLKASGAVCIECQSNDLLLSSLLFQFSQSIHSDVVLFEDKVMTEHRLPGIIFRPPKKDDTIFKHTVEPAGEYVLEKSGEIVATGGWMLHYNMPFADLYMEVKEDCRRMGLGSFLIQELKKECYLSGRVPAARCNIQNNASKGTLLKAGMAICGFMLTGAIQGETGKS